MKRATLIALITTGVLLMSSFEDAFTDVIGLEGGYVNDPDDPGGETKYGISKRSWPGVDIKNLTLEESKQIYWEHYWNPLRLQLMPEPVAREVFEQAVNFGKTGAVLNLQKALELLGHPVVVDGMLGEQTLTAVQKADAKLMVKILNGLQLVKYMEIVKHSPHMKKYFVGWLRRVG